MALKCSCSHAGERGDLICAGNTDTIGAHMTEYKERRWYVVKLPTAHRVRVQEDESERDPTCVERGLRVILESDNDHEEGEDVQTSVPF